jgi:signal transduction histidine kinase
MRFALLYAFIAALYILLSDYLLSRIATDPGTFRVISSLKGLGFVVVTAGLLYYLLLVEFRIRHKADLELQRLNRALRILSGSNQIVARAVHEPEMLAEVCRSITEVSGYSLAWIGVAEQDPARSIRLVASAGPETSYLQEISLSWADQELGRSPTGTAIRTKKTVICQDIRTNPDDAPWREAALRHGFSASLALPLLIENEVYGALNLYCSQAGEFDEQELHLLTDLASDLAFGIQALRERSRRRESERSLCAQKETLEAILDNLPVMVNMIDKEGKLIMTRQAETDLRRTRETVRTLSRRLSELEESERKRIARGLHDQVGQELTALNITLDIIDTLIEAGQLELARTKVSESSTIVEQATEHVRDLMTELRPPVLDEFGLMAALRWLAEQFSNRTGIKSKVSGRDPAPDLPASLSIPLFRIAQEALNNVLQHARAAQVDIMLEDDGSLVRLTIADDGAGFDPQAHETSEAGIEGGLSIMRERAESIGGIFQISSQPGSGTHLIVEVRR